MTQMDFERFHCIAITLRIPSDVSRQSGHPRVALFQLARLCLEWPMVEAPSRLLGAGNVGAGGFFSWFGGEVAALATRMLRHLRAPPQELCDSRFPSANPPRPLLAAKVLRVSALAGFPVSSLATNPRAARWARLVGRYDLASIDQLLSLQQFPRSPVVLCGRIYLVG